MEKTVQEMEYRLTFFYGLDDLVETDWLDQESHGAYMVAINFMSEKGFSGVPLLTIVIEGKTMCVNLNRINCIRIETRPTGSQIHTQEPQKGNPKVIAAVDSKDVGEKEVAD